MGKRAKEKGKCAGQTQYEKWYNEGYVDGFRFANDEADYDELAAIARAKGIPAKWDIFRAKILNSYLYNPLFDFQSYSNGFYKACSEFFNKI